MTLAKIIAKAIYENLPTHEKNIKYLSSNQNDYEGLVVLI